MSSRQSVYISMGVMIMIIIGMSMNYYSISQTQNTSMQNSKDIDRVESKIDDFIERWDARVQVSNKVQNSTQDKIEHAVSYILGNLTNHRLVTNDTNKDINELIAKFNETNEVERQKAVDRILQGIQNNTKLLDQLVGLQN